jgi:uncharacterized membrane protein
MTSATPAATPGVCQHVHRHPVNVAHLEDAPLADRIADRVVAFIGGWVFILIQTVAEEQNNRLLEGNTEILKRIEDLEKLILDLQKKALERMPTGG